MRTPSFKNLALMTACLAASLAAAEARAGEFHVPFGITFVQGSYNVMDKLKQNFRVTDSFVWPVGLSLSPYYEFSSGLGIGVEAGPATFLQVQRSFGSTSYNYIVPVGGYVRYSFLRDHDISPYVRAGMHYNFAGGDFLKAGDAGVFGMAGVEFLHRQRPRIAIEMGYDDSSVKVASGPLGLEKKATYGGFMASVLVSF